jgi:hypothetical protein
VSVHPTSDPAVHYDVREPCFKCGRSFTGAATIIQWRGDSESINLHRHCALQLGAHLIRDSFGDVHDGTYENHVDNLRP